MKFLLESITVVPRQLYPDQIPGEHTLMEKIDPKDSPFLALSLHLECPLWSDDVHLKRQSLVPCYSNQEFSGMLDDRDS